MTDRSLSPLLVALRVEYESGDDEPGDDEPGDDEPEVLPTFAEVMIPVEDLVGRRAVPADAEVSDSVCTRCRVGRLARDAFEPNNPLAWACISCGHRPSLTREEAYALERAMRGTSGPGRQPRHEGAAL